MSASRPLAVFSAGVLALGALGANGCGDSSDGDNNPSGKSEAPQPKAVTFGQRSASGEAAIAQAEGIIPNPEIIRLRVVAEPPQKVTVSYTLLCTVGGKTGGDSGQFSEDTPIDREIDLPDGKPTECNVSSNAQLEAGVSGKVTMKLRGQER